MLFPASLRSLTESYRLGREGTGRRCHQVSSCHWDAAGHREAAHRGSNHSRHDLPPNPWLIQNAVDLFDHCFFYFSFGCKMWCCGQQPHPNKTSHSLLPSPLGASQPRLPDTSLTSGGEELLCASEPTWKQCLLCLTNWMPRATLPGCGHRKCLQQNQCVSWVGTMGRESKAVPGLWGPFLAEWYLWSYSRHSVTCKTGRFYFSQTARALTIPDDCGDHTGACDAIVAKETQGSSLYWSASCHWP